MDKDDQKVHAFRVALRASGIHASIMWPRYIKIHGWGNHWQDVTEEQLDEAFAWLDRLKTYRPVLDELYQCLNLPEEE